MPIPPRTESFDDESVELALKYAQGGMGGGYPPPTTNPMEGDVSSDTDPVSNMDMPDAMTPTNMTTQDVMNPQAAPSQQALQGAGTTPGKQALRDRHLDDEEDIHTDRSELPEQDDPAQDHYNERFQNDTWGKWSKTALNGVPGAECPGCGSGNVSNPTGKQLQCNRCNHKWGEMGDYEPEDDTMGKWSSVDYLKTMRRMANDSDLYEMGWKDRQEGKEMDQALASLSQDYYQGYAQGGFYYEQALESAPPNLQDMTEGNNELPKNPTASRQKRGSGVDPKVLPALETIRRYQR